MKRRLIMCLIAVMLTCSIDAIASRDNSDHLTNRGIDYTPGNIGVLSERLFQKLDIAIQSLGNAVAAREHNPSDVGKNKKAKTDDDP